MRQVAKVLRNGEYKVMHDDDRNVFEVIYKWRELTDHGVVNRQMQMCSFTNLQNALMSIAEAIGGRR